MRLLTILFAILLHSSTFGQVGKSTNYWDWTPQKEHHKSVVGIMTDLGDATGVLVHVGKESQGGYEGHVLTAYHVVGDIEDQSFKVRYHNGLRSKMPSILAFDKENDVALLWVWVPKGIKPAEIGEEVVYKDLLEYAGLGGGSELECCVRHFSAKASSPTSESMIFSDSPLIAGDSGGPIFNEKNRVVGIISGGWFWFGQLKDVDCNEVKITWPARACNVGPIKKLMRRIKK